MRLLWIALIAPLLLAAPAQASASSAAPSSTTVVQGHWRITAVDLGTLGGASATPTDVNSWGAVVGASDTADGVSHPFVGHPLVGVAPLPGAPQYFSPAQVTDTGLVPGREAVYSTTAPTMAEVWESGTTARPLGSAWSEAGPAAETGTVLLNHVQRIRGGSNFILDTPVDCLTWTSGAPTPIPGAQRCLGITRGGRTVFSAAGFLPSSDVLRTTGGVTTRIPARAFGAYYSEVGGVTRFGDVLGTVPTGPTGGLRQPLHVVGDAWERLPRPAGLDPEAGIEPVRTPYASNVKHDLIGTALRPGAADPGYVGVLWKNGTTPEVLRAPGRDVTLSAINGRRDVVGWADDHAALWRDGSFVDLGTAVTGESRALWVTESGVAIGTRVSGDVTRTIAWFVTPAS